jgi:TetR/AcrR family transcriptional regulator, cholesterol catabolism regulator
MKEKLVQERAARPARKSHDRHERGRLEILEAAAPLFAAYGYHGMSMRDLSRATGMSLANLYNYFAAKEDLVFALQTRAFETLIASAEEAIAGAGDPQARLHAFILSHVRYVASHRDVMRVLVEEAGELPAGRRQAVRTLKDRYFQIGREVVAGSSGRARGHAALSGAELERVTYSIFGMLNWVYAWYDAARHGSPQEVARSVHRIALSGIGARTPSRSAQSATERLVTRVRVRSPIRLHHKRVA